MVRKVYGASTTLVTSGMAAELEQIINARVCRLLSFAGWEQRIRQHSSLPAGRGVGVARGQVALVRLNGLRGKASIFRNTNELACLTAFPNRYAARMQGGMTSSLGIPFNVP